jgi:hypothetical protein
MQQGWYAFVEKKLEKIVKAILWTVGTRIAP